MIGDIQWKACGLTSLVDAEAAAAAGADYLGFIFYPKSPRHVTHAQYQAMAPLLPKREQGGTRPPGALVLPPTQSNAPGGRLPPLQHVAVSVEPEVSEVQWFIEQGFDRVQIHFRPELPIEQVAAWSELVTADKLWLAPKIPPGTPFPPALLPSARTFLLDTFAPDKFGGTGKTGDWASYHELKAAHPDKAWILSGGLSPENVGEALRATDARFLDVNSGVESTPGRKDAAKLKAFAAAIRSAADTKRSTSGA
jgi:phosphoribosylanthranilate isomerase